MSETHFKINFVSKDNYEVLMPDTNGGDHKVHAGDLTSCCSFIETLDHMEQDTTDRDAIGEALMSFQNELGNIEERASYYGVSEPMTGHEVKTRLHKLSHDIRVFATKIGFDLHD